MDKHNLFSQNISQTDIQDKLLNIIETIIKQEETYLQDKLILRLRICLLYALCSASACLIKKICFFIIICFNKCFIVSNEYNCVINTTEDIKIPNSM